MSYRNTQAIVLSRTDWRESDRILTLISPELGRTDALCRGCRKPKSPLMAAGELFTMGEYVLFTGKGRQVVQSCQVIETFYPLRLDYLKLECAAVMAQASLFAIQPEEAQPHLYLLLARSLRRLAYQDFLPRAVLAAFLLHFAAITGVKPRLNHCVVCKKTMGEGEGGYLLPQEGGICCGSCGQQQPRRAYLAADSLSWLRQVLAHGIDKVQGLPEPLPLPQLIAYVEYQLDSRLPVVKSM